MTRPGDLVEPKITHYLVTREQAAAHLGLTLEAFDGWVRHGLVAKNPARQWTTTELDEALERARRGLQHDNPTRRHSHFIKIPRCQRISRKLQQGDGAGHWLFYFRPTGEPLPGPWGSREMMIALVKCEQHLARKHMQFASGDGLETRTSPPVQPELKKGNTRQESDAQAPPAVPRPDRVQGAQIYLTVDGLSAAGVKQSRRARSQTGGPNIRGQRLSNWEESRFYIPCVWSNGGNKKILSSVI